MHMSLAKEGITKEKLIYIAVFYLFIFKEALVGFIPILTFADELFAVLAIPLFVLHLSKNNFKLGIKKEGYAIWILLFIMSGLIGNIMYAYQPIAAVMLDVLLNFKFWLAIYTGICIYRSFSLQKNASFIFFHIKLLTLVFTVLIIADNLLGIFPSEVRHGIRSTALFFGHPTTFAAKCAWIIALLISIKGYIGQKIKFYFIWWVILLCSTMRSKAFATAMIFLVIYYFSYIRKKKITIKILLFFVPFVLLIAWNQVEFYFFSEAGVETARFQLLYKSFLIANEHFPFGTGFGTYGSWYSGVYYSPLYSRYELSNVYGLSENNAFLVSDSFWPMLLGQNGYIGMIIFIIAVWKLYKNILQIKVFDLDYYVSALIIISYVLISSMAESAFVNPLMVPMAMWSGFLLNSRKRNVDSVSYDCGFKSD